MKIFRPNFETVVSVLSQVINQNSHLGKTLDKALHSNKKLGSRDRDFIAKAVFKIIRYRRFYEVITSQENLSQASDVRLLAVGFLVHKEFDLNPWLEVEESVLAEIKKKISQATDHRITSSYTDYFYDYGLQHFGADWKLICDTLNRPANNYLRVNNFKTDINKLRNDLESSGTESEYVEGFPNLLCLTEKSKITKSPNFMNGEFEFQDLSSVSVVNFCDASQDIVVADVCCGAGGKALYLSEILGNKGAVYAFDIYENKLDTLNERAKKAGAKNIKTFLADNEIKESLRENVDLVLVDAPCSGSGVIKRNPENKWRIEADFINLMKEKQLRILHENAALVRKGGKLVYATCSIINEENTAVVQKFLELNKDFQLVKEQSLIPGINTEADGFYMAMMLRS